MKTDDDTKTDSTGQFVSALLHGTDAALAERGPDGATLEETMSKALAASRKTPSPPAVVFTGHSQSLAGEFRAKADTLKKQADDLLDKIKSREIERDAAIERIHNAANGELNQLEAEHADLIRSHSTLVSAFDELTK